MLVQGMSEKSQKIQNMNNYVRVKGPHNVGDFSGRSGRSPGSLLTYLGLYICSNAPKEDFPGIKKVFFDQQVYFFWS